MNSQIEDYQCMIKESAKHFSAAYRNGSSDFSAFESIFFRKIQTMLDPPLEISWFYAAVTLQSAKLNQNGRFGGELLLARDLFRLLTSCSPLSNGTKKIALLAPVVYEVYNILCDSLTKGMCLEKDLEDLTEEMVSYVTVCCCNDSENENNSDHPVVCFDDLVGALTIDRVSKAEVSDFRDMLKAVFPFLCGEILQGIDKKCGIQSLSGIVLFELFLLRLCLKFNTGVERAEIQAGLQTLAVQTIEGFKSCYFLDVLLRMLLEPTLSVTILLGSEKAVLLRKILYDAVMLVDYSFLHSDRWLQLHGNHLNRLALIWALVADAAVKFAREISDQGRTVSYANAFDNSHLLNQLIGWVSSRAGFVQKIRQNTTPRDVISWLCILQGQGLEVFDPDTSSILNKFAFSRSTSGFEVFNHNKDAHNLRGSILTNSRDDNVNEDTVDMDQEMFEPLKSGYPAGMCTGNTNFTEGTRKRKEGMFEVGETRAKHVKSDHHENAVCNHKVGGGNEVGNSVMDDDVEVMVTG